MKPLSVPIAVLMTVVGGSLDAYTFVSHGVFATAQTGNVILLIVAAVGGGAPLRPLLPIVAFTLAVLVVQPIKHAGGGRAPASAAAAVLGGEVVVLAIVGFLPGTASPELVTVPLAALAGLQLGLFRSAGDVSFTSIATTGNLLRLAEAGYAALVQRGPQQVRVFGVCAAVVAGFCVGAAIGAFATVHLHERAIWVTAAIQLLVLVLSLTSAPKLLDRAPTPAS